jgi:hypothetical protein
VTPGTKAPRRAHLKRVQNQLPYYINVRLMGCEKESFARAAREEGFPNFSAWVIATLGMRAEQTVRVYPREGRDLPRWV